MKLRALFTFTLAVAIGIAGCSTGTETTQGEPLLAEAAVISATGTIVGAKYQSREVTLEVPNKPGDNFVNVAVSDDVKNLSQIRFGDRVTVEYYEAVFVDRFRAGDVDPGVSLSVAAAAAEPGERPAGGAAKKLSVVAVIEAIDRENELVTLRGPEGGRKVVKARNPANLDMVQVGDKIRISFVRGVAVSVTPSPVR